MASTGMSYRKPGDVSYTDMAIYIDNHIYTGHYDETLVFKYIYFLVFMLARKAQYFKTV